MREKILMKLAGWHASYPWRMLLVVTVTTVILAGFASQLSVTTRTSDLLPEGDPKVEQFNTIIDEFQTATNLVVVVEGEEHDIKAFADILAERILEIRDTTHNQEYREEIQKLREKIFKLSQKKDKEEEIAGLRSRIQELDAGIGWIIKLPSIF
jgi:predicted RND superfamily exporter protein